MHDVSPSAPAIDPILRAAADAAAHGDLPGAARHLSTACIPNPPDAPTVRAQLAHAIGDLLDHARDTRGADLARRSGDAPEDPDASFDLGYHLMGHGLAHLAEAFLAPAAAARPDAVPVWLEYLAALDRIGRHDRAIVVTDANPALVERSAGVRYLRAFHTLMTGNLDAVAEALPGLDDPEDPVVAAGRHRLGAVLDRARALRRHAPLDDADVRGWHLALNGALLLHRADESRDTMRGRYAMFAPTMAQLAATLHTATAVLDRLDATPPRVVVAPGRDSAIVGHALARLLDIPVDPLVPSDHDRALVVAWDLDLLDPPTIATMQGIQPARPVFALGVRWTEAPPFAPDLTGWLHQILLPPWEGAFETDREAGGLHRLPPDSRASEAIAAEIAGAAVEVDDLEIRRIAKFAAACRDLAEASRPGLFRTRGTRPILWEGAPVHSARFL